MIIELLIFLVAIFLLSTIFSFILKGALNVHKFWIYFDEFLGFIFIFGIIYSFAFFIKHPTFSFIIELTQLAWGLILLTLAFVVFIIVIGIEIGNFLEKIILK
ncbi:hypothetical protein HYT25_04365 [Candidatus Pacearchaeota archaeon]|nr:hypothetical protein [Candidatus Pacearchaeota archaeon]